MFRMNKHVVFCFKSKLVLFILTYAVLLAEANLILRSFGKKGPAVRKLVKPKYLNQALEAFKEEKKKETLKHEGFAHSRDSVYSCLLFTSK